MIDGERLIGLLEQATVTPEWAVLQGILRTIEEDAEISEGTDREFATDRRDQSRAFFEVFASAVLFRHDVDRTVEQLALELLRPTGDDRALAILSENFQSRSRPERPAESDFPGIDHLAAMFVQAEFLDLQPEAMSERYLSDLHLTDDERGYVGSCFRTELGSAETSDDFGGQVPSNYHPSSDIRPGDCLFRDLTPPVLKLSGGLRKFGHVGVYLGLVDQDGDASDWNNHAILEMSGRFFAGKRLWPLPRAGMDCVRTTVKDFKGKGKFWGCYGVPIDDKNRAQIVQHAKKLENQCIYAIRRYKDPNRNRFRCDGFIEHLYETLQATVQPLQYRGGLFEDDNWTTMSPASLRNCLTEKRSGV